MAAYLEGYAVGPNGTDVFYGILRTAMLANGWTLYDTIANTLNNRDQVFRSTPVDATANNCCYLRITITGSTFIWYIYVDWDPVTHTGAKQGGHTSAATVGSNTSQYWLRVNEFAVAFSLVRPISFTHGKAYAGFVRRMMAPTKGGLTCTSTPHVGTDTTVNVMSDMTGKLLVGQRVVMYNHSHNSASANFLRAGIFRVRSLTSTTITFASALGGAYDAGAVIGWNPHPGFVMTGSLGSVDDLASGYACMNHDGAWGSSTNQAVALTSQVLTNTESELDPDNVEGDYRCGVFSLSSALANVNGFHGTLYHWEAVACFQIVLAILALPPCWGLCRGQYGCIYTRNDPGR
jgi:hypothetical protein